MSDAQDGQVTRCLAHLQAQGPRVEPSNPCHIAAFQALRQVNKRITAAAFMAFMESLQTTVLQSASLTTACWLCPKGDMPSVLPPHLSRAVITKGQLRQLGAPLGGVGVHRC